LLDAYQAVPVPAVIPTPVAEKLTEVDRINLEINLRWLLERERDRLARQLKANGKPATMERVGVFADAGVWHVGAKSIVDSLEQQDVPCRVLDRSLLTNETLKELEVVILPGGWAPLQWSAAGGKGLAAIKTYVENGGRCFAVCAGAYLLAKTTRYEGKDYPYPLGLFDGVAEGPVPGLAAFPKPGMTRLKATEAGKKRGLESIQDTDVYYSGGPCFKDGTDVEVLARYHDDTPALIVRPFGKGQIVLTGVHLERPPPALGGDDAPTPPQARLILKKLLFP
jgi:glutamine amidotransferase-like uncharacterized protein